MALEQRGGRAADRVTRPTGVVIVSSHNARHLLVHPLLTDAPLHKNFPSAELRPGAVYRNRIEWRFSR